jgi:N-acetylglucosaminyldiphosphoundecaprenol N-acetyl-beta-D-mannosaminyltransferase
VLSPVEPLASAERAWPRVALRGVAIDALTETQCVEHVMAELAQRRGGWVVTPNLDHLRRLVRQREFRELCAGASLVVADGMPLLWAARLQGTPLPERVAGSNLIWSLSRAAGSQKKRVFFLGGDPGTAESAARILSERFPGLVPCGTMCPAPGFERDPAQMSALRSALESALPDLVYVALGSPKQERLIADLRALLPETWWLGLGISFSFVSGDVRRAPRWMQRIGLEWTHRLVQEPRRLARRYLVDGLPFAAQLLVGSAWRGLRGGAATSR